MENGTESLGKNENSLEEQVQVEIGSGDEERLLPTDLLNDPDDECINENQTVQKPALRKTWSWTPLKGKIKYTRGKNNTQPITELLRYRE